MIKLSFCQNDSPMGGSFWQKDSLITHILFELWLITLLWIVSVFLTQTLIGILFNPMYLLYVSFMLYCFESFVGEIRFMQGVGVNSLLARIIFLQNFCTFLRFQKALNEAKPRKCMNTYIYFLKLT